MTHLPDAILFDLDETILSFGHRPALLEKVAGEFAEAFAPLGPAQVAERLEQLFQAFWADADRHKAWRARPLVESRRHIAIRAFAELREEGASGLTDEVAVSFADRFHEYREAQCDFFPDACETLDEIRARGVKMALVTNGLSEIQRAKIDRFDLARRFDHIQIEGEHGFGKPEERAYLHALDALGATAAETWMVGDNLEWEVVAPQRLGIFAIWHDPYGVGLPEDSPIRPDRIIRSLKELLEP